MDSLRVINLETTLEQRHKRDVYLTIALGLSALAAITAATESEDGFKASLTGGFAALGGLATGLNAKFRHDEDATLSEVCAKFAESELLTFQIPADAAAFEI